MKDANGFFHISPCMEGRGIERQAKSNYRKPENQSQHNDFPICGKNQRRKRKTKGSPTPSLSPLFQDQLKIAKSVPDHIERGIPKGLMHYTFYIPKPGMTAFRPV